MKTIISREPWWASPPKNGQSILDMDWGYLEYYSDGSWVFVRERPSDNEILNRKSCFVPESSYQ